MYEIAIAGRRCQIAGDDYAKSVGSVFEPETVNLMARLCEQDSICVDIGANIGLTAIALSQICPAGEVYAFEPVPTTFEYLQKNVAGIKQIRAYNVGLGRKASIATMEGYAPNGSGFFVSDRYTVAAHASCEVKIETLDGQLADCRTIDFVKIDVEGHEIEVLEGGRNLLNRCQAIVLLEMNHWCLNILKRMTLPEFRERLLSFFPVVFAVQGTEYLDFTDDRTAHHVFHENLTRMHFVDIVCGFDKPDLVRRLSVARQSEISRLNAQIDEAQLRIYALEENLKGLKTSASWRLTAPFRAIRDRLTDAAKTEAGSK